MCKPKDYTKYNDFVQKLSLPKIKKKIPILRNKDTTEKQLLNLKRSPVLFCTWIRSEVVYDSEKKFFRCNVYSLKFKHVSSITHQ